MTFEGLTFFDKTLKIPPSRSSIRLSRSAISLPVWGYAAGYRDLLLATQRFADVHAALFFLSAEVGLFADGVRTAGLAHLQSAVLNLSKDTDDLLRAMSFLHVFVLQVTLQNSHPKASSFQGLDHRRQKEGGEKVPGKKEKPLAQIQGEIVELVIAEKKAD